MALLLTLALPHSVLAQEAGPEDLPEAEAIVENAAQNAQAAAQAQAAAEQAPEGQAAAEQAAAEPPQFTFPILRYDISGNTLYPEAMLRLVVGRYTGPGKTAQDVEAARSALEKYHQERGYPTVVVNIPEQTVDDGIVQLVVIENRIRSVYVVDNRYFSRQFILDKMPSLAPDKIISLPVLQEQLAEANSVRDLKVTPVIIPLEQQGYLDVELEVEDELPMHGSFGFNDRATRGASELRFNFSISYDNLWQRGHSIAFNYVNSPLNFEDVEVYSGSYLMPSPFNDDHLLSIFGVKSNSARASGGDVSTLGKGVIIGARYIIPLPTFETYSHNVTLGLDYKDFDETIGLGGDEEDLESPATYMPLSFAYSGFWSGATGQTTFSAALNLLIRGLLSDLEEFREKRFLSDANYVYFTGGIERRQRLPAGFNLFVKVDGQIADQPLISSEQYSAGGVASVRGFKESDALGDNAFHTTTEISNTHTNFSSSGDSGVASSANPYLFYDGALLWTRQPLEGQEERLELHGTGVGVRGNVGILDYQVDVAAALNETPDVGRFDVESYFRVDYRF